MNAAPAPAIPRATMSCSGLEKTVDAKDAMAKADFPSIRGPFKFNTNHFPIENFYLLETVKGADGKLSQVTRATVFENHADVYAAECPMK